MICQLGRTKREGDAAHLYLSKRVCVAWYLDSWGGSGKLKGNQSFLGPGPLTFIHAARHVAFGSRVL